VFYPLLTTKLHLPPARPKLVRRPRLTAQLGEGLRPPLTLLSAPAGFGKTTLLSEWRATPDVQTDQMVWFSLDSGDNDPRRFWAYVMAALRAVPELAGLPAELDADAPPELLLAPLINGLGDCGPLVLVLDDYHVIEASAIHAAVFFLVEHLPAGLRLVILTRSDPPWPLARLRVGGQISELREADLRFTSDEALEFLTGSMGLNLTTGDVALLERETEGWIAALQMAAISLDGHPDPHGFITGSSGENRYIADYLAEEVLALQPEPLRRFMLRISLLERMNSSLCDAVTGCSDSRVWLEEIERKGLFLIPLDSVRHWFRFHHLFGDLLRTPLHRVEPELVPTLHVRASAWYTAHGQTFEAMGHILAARDYDRAGELFEQHAGGWWAFGHPRLLDLMQQLPEEVRARSPAICTFNAWYNCVTGQLDAATALIETVERHPSLPHELRAFLATMRVYITELSGKAGDGPAPELTASACIPEENASIRNSVDMMLAFIHQMNGRFEEAAALLVQAAERDVAGRSTNSITIAIPRLVRLLLIQGRVAEAKATCCHYLSLVQERGAARFMLLGNLHAVFADALRVQGDLAGAEEQAKEAVRCNAAWSVPLGITMAAQSLARVRFAQGDARGALDLLQQEETATRGRTLPIDLVNDRTALRVRSWLALNDLEAAERWARDSGLTPYDPLSFRRELDHLTLARVLLATGRVAEGEALVSRLAAAAVAGGRLARLEEIHSLRRLAASQLAEPLSEREQEILGLLAAGCSNQEIAGRLVVAVGTVKVHLHNIFRKLEAPSRTRAVARARELGLLR
jgi:LuxR family transcriptional regulator, maltose regulon positive regulatory protein